MPYFLPTYVDAVSIGSQKVKSRYTTKCQIISLFVICNMLEHTKLSPGKVMREGQTY